MEKILTEAKSIPGARIFVGPTDPTLISELFEAYRMRAERENLEKRNQDLEAKNKQLTQRNQSLQRYADTVNNNWKRGALQRVNPLTGQVLRRSNTSPF
jgi:hypothetical protein